MKTISIYEVMNLSGFVVAATGATLLVSCLLWLEGGCRRLDENNKPLFWLFATELFSLWLFVIWGLLVWIFFMCVSEKRRRLLKQNKGKVFWVAFLWLIANGIIVSIIIKARVSFGD